MDLSARKSNPYGREPSIDCELIQLSTVRRIIAARSGTGDGTAARALAIAATASNATITLRRPRQRVLRHASSSASITQYYIRGPFGKPSRIRFRPLNGA